MKISLRLCAITCSLMLSSVAHAMPINYTYDSGEFSSGASITGDFTVNLAANITDIYSDQTLIDFTFTYGTVTLSSTNGAAVDFSGFLTDTQGHITDFQLRVSRPIMTGQSGLHNFQLVYDDGIDPIGAGNVAYVTTLTWQINRHRSSREILSNTRGTLIPVASVPEPGTLGLLAAGLLGVGIRRKIGRRRA